VYSPALEVGIEFPLAEGKVASSMRARECDWQGLANDRELCHISRSTSPRPDTVRSACRQKGELDPWWVESMAQRRAKCCSRAKVALPVLVSKSPRNQGLIG
jgi:hypothetical protein